MQTDQTGAEGAELPVPALELSLSQNTMARLMADAAGGSFSALFDAAADAPPLNNGAAAAHSNSPESAAGASPFAHAAAVSCIGDLPINTSYPGPFDFELEFPMARESAQKKTISYRFIESSQKLFVRIKVHCPIHFRTSAPPPKGAVIRAMIIYSEPKDMLEPPRRCMNHIMEDRDRLDCPDFLLRCHNPTAQFEQQPDGRHTVSFAWSPPPLGTDVVRGVYEFMCFSSCSGSINRRPTQLIFALEDEHELYGRCVIELKVCACPGRDADLEGGAVAAGNKVRRRAVKQEQPTPPRPQRVDTKLLHARRVTAKAKAMARGACAPDNRIYTVHVRGRRLYKMVMSIIRNHELSQQYENLVAPNSAAAAADAAAYNPMQFTSQSPIGSWLHSINLGRLATDFLDEAVFTMADLDGRLTDEVMRKVGASQAEADQLRGCYVQWRSVDDHSCLSSLESNSSVVAADHSPPFFAQQPSTYPLPKPRRF